MSSANIFAAFDSMTFTGLPSGFSLTNSPVFMSCLKVADGSADGLSLFPDGFLMDS